MSFLSLLALCFFPGLSMTQSAVKVLDPPHGENQRNPALRTRVQVPSTDFRGVVLDGDCQEEPHLTWIVQSCSLGCFLPDTAQKPLLPERWEVLSNTPLVQAPGGKTEE